jgi:hypothetical protein
MFVRIIGFIIIIWSFVFVLRRPDKSLMETLMEHKQKQMEKMEQKTEQKAQLDSLKNKEPQ